jgi:hypothetical protein
VFCASDSCQPDSFCGQVGRCLFDGETRVSTQACIICTNFPDDVNNPCSIFNSCQPNGQCVPIAGVSVAGEPVEVSASPISSGDPFTVIGTSDGRICARGLDGSVPGSNLQFPTALWASGCLDLDPSDDAPTRSSPIISQTGIIYVTTDAGLYAIK